MTTAGFETDVHRSAPGAGCRAKQGHAGGARDRVLCDTDILYGVRSLMLAERSGGTGWSGSCRWPRFKRAGLRCHASTHRGVGHAPTRIRALGQLGHGSGSTPTRRRLCRVPGLGRMGRSGSEAGPAAARVRDELNVRSVPGVNSFVCAPMPPSCPAGGVRISPCSNEIFLADIVGLEIG